MAGFRSIAWSLLALAFLILAGIFLAGAIAFSLGLVIFNPQLLLFLIVIMIWPFNFPYFPPILVYFMTLVWWLFIAGFSILVLHYIIKLFFRKKKVPVVISSKLPYVGEEPNIIALIPAHNEEKTIADVIRGVLQHVNNVLVLNDGSKDKTAVIAKEAGALVISNDYKMGLGISMKKAFKNALRINADIIVTIDADGQYDPKEIPKLLDPIVSNEADLVLGSRFLEKGSIEKMSRVKKLGNKVFTWAMNRFTGLHLTDSATGFRAFRREILEEIPITSNYSYTQEMIIRAAYEGFRILDVPTVFLKRPHGKSRLISDPADYGLNVSLIGLRVYRDYHPLSLFGAFGVIFMALGILVGVYYIAVTSYGIGALHLASLILCAVLLIIGIQILLFALLADMFITRDIRRTKGERGRDEVH